MRNMMTHGRIATLSLALMLALGVALPTAQALADEDITQKVQTAKTAADHEAIASYYDAQAAEASQKAAMHKKMGESYKSFATSSGKGSGVSAMPQHCAALAKTYSAEAAHYKAMADTERKLAKAAK